MRCILLSPQPFLFPFFWSTLYRVSLFFALSSCRSSTSGSLFCALESTALLCSLRNPNGGSPLRYFRIPRCPVSRRLSCPVFPLAYCLSGSGPKVVTRRTQRPLGPVVSPLCRAPSNCFRIPTFTRSSPVPLVFFVSPLSSSPSSPCPRCCRHLPVVLSLVFAVMPSGRTGTACAPGGAVLPADLLHSPRVHQRASREGKTLAFCCLGFSPPGACHSLTLRLMVAPPVSNDLFSSEVFCA